MFSALVNIDNQEGLLRPGMNAEVNLRIASRMDIPAVPTMALRTMRDISASETYLGLEEGWIREQLRLSETTETASKRRPVRLPVWQSLLVTAGDRTGSATCIRGNRHHRPRLQ